MFCVYIFGCVTFKILGKGTFILVQCLFLHLKVLLFVTIFIHKQYSHFHYYIIAVLYYHVIMILLYYITKLHYSRFQIVMLLSFYYCFYYHIYLFSSFIHFLFSLSVFYYFYFHFPNSSWSCVPFAVLSRISLCRYIYCHFYYFSCEISWVKNTRQRLTVLLFFPSRLIYENTF